ncbi:protein phosphatase 2C domain-containing protein [Lentzea sp. NPDC051213]|uniref:protein phosphatase 2C domain-containing protein n=1 Tax=Lentzea sp. NPDC051213 TaxID=3364126 RepID=UPI003798391A
MKAVVHQQQDGENSLDGRPERQGQRIGQYEPRHEAPRPKPAPVPEPRERRDQPEAGSRVTVEVKPRANPFAAGDPAAMVPPVLGGTPDAAKRPWYLQPEPAQSGVAADQIRIGDLDVRAASVVGPDHRCEEPAEARQDAYRIGRDARGRYLIVAVADGMSAAKRSDVGATVAVRAAVDLVRKELDHGARPEQLDLRGVFKAVAGNVAGAAKQLGCAVDQVLTALIVAIVPTTGDQPDGRRPVWFATVGDVSAACLRDGGWRRLTGADKAGLDRNTLDAFLPHHPDRVVLNQDEVTGAIAVMTDGVSDVWGDVPGAAEWFSRRWRTPPPLASFLLDVSYEAPGQVDDRTAVVVWCGGGERR